MVTFCEFVILSIEEELLQHQDVVVPEDWVKEKYVQDMNSVFLKLYPFGMSFPYIICNAWFVVIQGSFIERRK